MTTATRTKRRGGTGCTIPSSDLKRALAAVAPAVAARGPKPVLANVLFKDGTVTATDLELRIEAPLPGADVTMLLPHERLTAIVNAAGAVDEIEITADGTKATIRAGNGEWVLPTEDPLEFPGRADAEAKAIARLPADQWRTMASTVRFATDTESSRYALGAVLVEFKAGTLSLVATDGRRLAIAECEVDQATDDSTTLAPRRAVDVLVRLAATGETVQLEATPSELVATVDDKRIYARLIEGRFPRWRDVDVSHKVTPTLAIAGALAHACSMASVCTSEDSKGTDWRFTGEGIAISGQSSSFGVSSATCDIVEAGHATTVKLDPVFVLEWLRTIDQAETVTIEAKDDQSAVVFKAGDCRQIVMPMAKE